MTGRTWQGTLTDVSGLPVCTFRYTFCAAVAVTSGFDGYGRLTAGQACRIKVCTELPVEARLLVKTYYVTLADGVRYTIEDATYRAQAGIGQRKADLILSLS